MRKSSFLPKGGDCANFSVFCDSRLELLEFFFFFFKSPHVTFGVARERTGRSKRRNRIHLTVCITERGDLKTMHMSMYIE